MHDRAPERILELRRLAMLRPLPTHALVEMLPAFSIEVCRPTVELLAQGEPVAHVAWVLEGRADCARDGRPIGSIDAGDPIGLWPALARIDAPWSARAATRIRVARISTERLFELLEDSFALVHTLLGSLATALEREGRRTLGSSAPIGALPSEIDFTERLVRLRMIPPFSRAPIRALARLAQRSEARRWPRGARIWRSGSEADRAIVILQGELDEGGVRLGPGQTAGLLGALARTRRDAEARAASALVGIELDAELLMDVIEDDDDLALELLRASALDLCAIRAHVPPRRSAASQ